ncbi:MAG: alpha/beta hydrolase [Actinomycetes bacterium]
MALNKQFAQYLEAREKMKMPAPWDVSMEEYRFRTLPVTDFIGVPEPIFSVEHRVISGPNSYLPIRIYRPSDEPNLPVMLYIHGGGWVIGNMDGFEPTVRSLSNKGNFVVIQVQYQKAPEHPFPTPFNDCYATLEWIVRNASMLKIDPRKIGVGGDSAGGNLAAAVALKARDTGLVNLAFQMLVYPCTGHDSELPTAKSNAEGFGLTSKVMRWFESQYAPTESELTNPYAFPALAKDHSNLAPAIVVTAEFDPLADDGRLYASTLEKAGVRTIFREFEGAIRGFNALAGVATDVATEVQNFLAVGVNSFLPQSE